MDPPFPAAYALVELSNGHVLAHSMHHGQLELEPEGRARDKRRKSSMIVYSLRTKEALPRLVRAAPVKARVKGTVTFAICYRRRKANLTMILTADVALSRSLSLSLAHVHAALASGTRTAWGGPEQALDPRPHQAACPAYFAAQSARWGYLHI